MNDVRSDIGPAQALNLVDGDIEACIRHLLRFMGKAKIDGLRAVFADLDADGNWCRTLLRNEEVPWPLVAEELDRRTMRGARRLRTVDLPPEMMKAAWVGLVLRALDAGIPKGIRGQVADKLLDCTANRGASVLMEWSVALFYHRRGFRLNWNEGAGFEFRADGHGLSFEVECKRIFRKIKERLDLRGVATISHALHEALVRAGWCGEVFCDTALTKVPAGLDVAATISAALPASPPPAGLDIDIPEIGRLTGFVRLVPAKPEPGLWRDVTRRMRAKPHDYRGCVGPVPLKADPRGAVLGWVRGPRITEEEHAQLIRERLVEGAGQLSGAVPGLLFAEHQDVRDVNLYAEKTMFQEASAAAFAANPAIAAVIWRTDQEQVRVEKGFALRQELFVERNPTCTFPGTDRIPFIDEL